MKTTKGLWRQIQDGDIETEPYDSSKVEMPRDFADLVNSLDYRGNLYVFGAIDYLRK